MRLDKRRKYKQISKVQKDVLHIPQYRGFCMAEYMINLRSGRNSVISYNGHHL